VTTPALTSTDAIAEDTTDEKEVSAATTVEVLVIPYRDTCTLTTVEDDTNTFPVEMDEDVT